VIRINKAGYLYIILTITVGFSAVNTSNNLVYIIASAMLSYMLVSGIFGSRNIYGVDVKLELPSEIFAGTDVPVGIRLTNRRKFMPSFILKVRAGDREVFFPFVSAGTAETRYCTLSFEKRGHDSLGEVLVCSVFPFSLFTRFRKCPGIFDLTIFPKPLPCRLMDLQDRQRGGGGETPSTFAGFDSDILSIRDYVAGDPLKYISWKSTAKTGRLKTKELSSVKVRHVMINFDAMDRTRLEETISCVTFGILKFVRSNIPVGLQIDGQLLRPGTSPIHKAKLLTKLALYGQD
jgi:uncharacterized protein (DUF58 family)